MWLVWSQAPRMYLSQDVYSMATDLQTLGKPLHCWSQSVSLQSQLMAKGLMHRSPSLQTVVLGLAASQPLVVSRMPPG